MLASIDESKLRVWGRLSAIIVLALFSVVSLNQVVDASSLRGLQGKSAKQVWALAVAAAEAKGAVHVVVKPEICCEDTNTNVFATSGTLVADIGLSEGEQSYSSGDMYGNAMVLVFPGMAYMQGDTSWTTLYWSWPSYYAGKWLAFSPSTSSYQDVISAGTLGALLSSVHPTGRLTLTPKTTIEHKKVVGVSGGLNTTHSHWPPDVKGSAVVYVSAVAPYLPVEVVYHVTENGRKRIATGTFSEWGEPISLTAPANSVPAPS